MGKTLAYELFRYNQDFEGEFNLADKLIRKVYVSKTPSGFLVEFDDKLPEETGSDEAEDNEGLVRELRLIAGDFSGLRDDGTSGNSPKPYVFLYGRNTPKEIGLYIGDKKKDGYLWLAYNKETGSIKQESEGALRWKGEKNRTKIEGELLYELYKDNEIVFEKNEQTFVNTSALIAVANSFFKAISKEKIKEMKRKLSFQLCILPKRGQITQDKEHIVTNEAGTDAFGVAYQSFPDAATQTAKFFSFDEPGFNLNLKSGNELYRQLGIGNNSFDKINLRNGFKISGLVFYFFDIINPDRRFNEKRSGFFDQVKQNYVQIKQSATRAEEKGELKVVAMKKNNDQQIILFDCNLTFDQLEEIFKNSEAKEDTRLLFENTLIIKEGRTTLWNDYVFAIGMFLMRNKIERNWLLRRFDNTLRRNRNEWLENSGGFFPKLHDAYDFFKKTGLCFKYLCGEDAMVLTEDEDFALKAGKVAGAYIRFKRKTGETSNALNDILTYSKYDENKLRHVLNRVASGIFLSKAEEAHMKDIEKFVSENTPKVAKLEKPNEDYSYFFYRGVFEEISKEA